MGTASVADAGRMYQRPSFSQLLGDIYGVKKHMDCNAGKPFDVVRLTSKRDPTDSFLAVYSNEKRTACSHAVWRCNPPPHVGMGEVEYFRDDEYACEDANDAIPAVPEHLYEEHEKNVGSAKSWRWTIMQTDTSKTARGGAPMTVLVSGADARVEEARRLLREYAHVASEPDVCTVQDDDDDDAGAFEMSFQVSMADAVDVLVNVFIRHGFEAMSAACLEEGKGTRSILVERLQARAPHLFTQDYRADPASVQPRRDKANWPQNFLVDGETFACTFEALAKQTQGAVDRLPTPLCQYRINEEVARREQVEEDVRRRRAQLDDHEDHSDLLASFPADDEARRAYHERRLLSDAEVAACRTTLRELESVLALLRHHRKIETPTVLNQLKREQQHQLKTCFYQFEVARDVPSQPITQLLLRVYRWHGAVVRYHRPYTYKGEHSNSRGKGKRTRAFAPGHPSGCHVSEPGLDQTKNGRGVHCRADPYVAVRRLTPPEMPPQYPHNVLERSPVERPESPYDNSMAAAAHGP